MSDQTNNISWAPLIIIHGLKESGKSTAASYLIDRGYTRVKFAGPLKNMIRVILRECGVLEDIIEDYIEGHLKEVPVPEMNDPHRPEFHVTGFSDELIWKLVHSLLEDAGLGPDRLRSVMLDQNRDTALSEFDGVCTVNSLFSSLRYDWSGEMLKGEVITTRRMMQTLGEEWRNLHHQLLWVKMAFSKVVSLLADGAKVVIDDNRYPFEFQAFAQFMPYRFVITRGERHFEPISPSTHPGERPMLVEWFDAHLKNDGTREFLYKKIAQYLDLDADYRHSRKNFLAA
jgi:hypothetical protein